MKGCLHLCGSVYTSCVHFVGIYMESPAETQMLTLCVIIHLLNNKGSAKKLGVKIMAISCYEHEPPVFKKGCKTDQTGHVKAPIL